MIFLTLFLTSTVNMLRCQILSQLVQVGVLPVVQLPARDAQVEPEPRRVGLHILCPTDFVVALLLTVALPGDEEETSCSFSYSVSILACSNLLVFCSVYCNQLLNKTY